MKHIKCCSKLAFLVILFLAFASCTQNKKSVVATNPNIKDVAKEIMTNAKTCALITVDSLNRPRVRMMGILKPDEDFTVWLGTNPKSRKVAQIQQNAEVTLYYTEEGNSGYVMLQGTAQLVNDAKVKEVHWKDEWKAFYPNYPDDYQLIKISPNWMEVVSYKHNIISESDTWKPQILVFN